MTKTFSHREGAFLAALNFYATRDFKGKQKDLADAGGISGGYLSEMIQHLKVCKPNKREAIAKAAAPELETYEDFIKIGLSLLDNEPIGPSNPGPIPFNKANTIDQITRKKHHWLVDQFKNDPLAVDINSDLLEIEKRSPEKLKDVQLFLKGMLAGLPELKSEGKKTSGE